MKLYDHCMICKDPIKLYEPYYTVRTREHIGTLLKFNSTNEYALCPNCFHAYENFLIEQTTHENHKKHMEDIKK